jgi:O-antigen/teichoic acid export membrane protein
MQVQQDTKRLKNLTMRAVAISAFVFAPAFAGMAAVAEPLVLTLFGSKWIDTVPLLQITAFTQLSQAIGRPLLWLFMVGGRTGELARWQIASGCVYTSVVLIASLLGSVQDVALAMLAVSVTMFVPRAFFTGRIVGIKPHEVASCLWGTAVATLAMLGVIALVVRAPGWLGIEVPMFVQLMLQVGCGGLSYLGAAAALRLPALHEALSLIASSRSKARGQQPPAGDQSAG